MIEARLPEDFNNVCWWYEPMQGSLYQIKVLSDEPLTGQEKNLIAKNIAEYLRVTDEEYFPSRIDSILDEDEF